MKSKLLIAAVTVLTLAFGPSAFAQESTAEVSSAVKEKQSKFCPICGPSEKMEGDAKYTHEFDGETYFFCSEACLDEFKVNPEKYTKMMKENNYSEDAHEDNKEESHEGHDHGKEGDPKRPNQSEEGSEHEGHDHK